MGNPLEWSLVDKSLLLTLFSIIGVGSIYLQLDALRDFALSFPNVTPASLAAFRGTMGAILACWLAWVAVGLWLRRRVPGSLTYVYLTMIGFGLQVLPAAWFVGPFTSPIWMIAACSTMVSALFFPLGVTLCTVVIQVCGIVGISLLTWFGVLPHASLGETPPDVFAGNPVAGAWIGMMAGNTLLFMAMGVAAFSYTVSQWRRREQELVLSRQRLERAADLIRRYVASQVADRILHGEADTPGTQQRRKLTVCFSDLKGFAEAADMMASEDLSYILNEYLSEMAAIAVAHGGTIDKFIGDAVMVFFGAPGSMADREQALAAVRMAMAMHRRMEYLRQKWFDEGIQFPFDLRVGINTGIASVGSFGSRDRLDYTAIGKQVNLAARLEEVCEPGRILVSHPTWALVKGEYTCTPRGELHVPGIHHPVKVYEVSP